MHLLLRRMSRAAVAQVFGHRFSAKCRRHAAQLRLTDGFPDREMHDARGVVFIALAAASASIMPLPMLPSALMPCQL